MAAGVDRDVLEEAVVASRLEMSFSNSFSSNLSSDLDDRFDSFSAFSRDKFNRQ